MTNKQSDRPTAEIELKARELAKAAEIPPWFMLPSYVKNAYRAQARETMKP